MIFWTRILVYTILPLILAAAHTTPNILGALLSLAIDLAGNQRRNRRSTTTRERSTA